MKPETIDKLNHLNQHFYETVAPDFDQTRQQPWEGWDLLLPHLKEKFAGQSSIRIIDIGCGNGRFGEYLSQNLPDHEIEYVGLDNNDFLLTQAQHKLAPLTAVLQLAKADIIGSLTSHASLADTTKKTFDLVVALGIIHHIPTINLRRAFIHLGLSYAKPNGLVVLAAWQFDQGEKLIRRAVDPSTVGIEATELEPEDYILPWERGATAYRYCHLLKPSVIPELLPQDAHIRTTFLADGKEQKSNYYFVVEKTLK